MDKSGLEILNQVQSGILKGHGRQFVWCTFLKLPIDKKLASEWVFKNLNGVVTSAKSQIDDTELFKKNKFYTGIPLVGFYLSGNGYRKICEPSVSTTKIYSKKELIKLDQQESHPLISDLDKTAPLEDIFLKGMYDPFVRNYINDKSIGAWHKDYKDNDFDGLLTIAENNYDRLTDLHSLLEKSLNNIGGKFFFTEKGEKLYDYFDGQRKPVEPFGFVDGITKINFFEKYESSNPYKLIPERQKIVLDDNLGSYLVFRKLDQNVDLFNKKIEELLTSRDFFNHRVSKEYVEAQVMGRFKNGTPLAISNQSKITQREREEVNRFNEYYYDPNEESIYHSKSFFEEDKHGLKCPFHAHIRKVNPRKNMSTEEFKDLPNPIIRRSIPYRQDGKTGLLFMCFQSNIINQFMEIQHKWCNNPPFDSDDYNPIWQDGLDPIAGQPSDGMESSKQTWNIKWNEPNLNLRIIKDFSFFDGNDSIIKLLGGGFFYAPPMAFFKAPSNWKKRV